MIILLLGLTAVVSAGTPTVDKETYKNQYCTDPRTMKKHPAYTEWADTYSCTRHRCQPGGRNLAIYTVGCKRIEAPESAIECEEVVEDTNMQFPFCCTRLRCLVLVRGEVWTKVLGQPWEILPAAPWSHMYKMKKPPPAGSTAVPKTQEQGPIFELSENEPEAGAHDKVPRSGKKPVTDNTNWNEKDPAPVPSPAMPLPDIATVSSTNEGKESHKSRRNKRRNSNARTPATYVEVTESEKHTEPVNLEVEETPASTEKPQEIVEEETEKYFPNNADIQKAQHKSHKSHNMYRPEIPQNQWNEPTEGLDLSEHLEIPSPNVEDLELLPKKEPAEKPSNLQVLVDAIGTRMRDIESVVQKMSDKVQNVTPDPDCSTEKRTSAEREGAATRPKEAKRPSTDDDTYKSDASNSVLRRKNPLKDLKPTYMAPVDNHRKAHVIIADPDNAETTEKKHKKHSHKKRKNKGSHSHKKRPRSKDDKRKHFKKLPEGSVETEKNAISLDDSSGAAQ